MKARRRTVLCCLTAILFAFTTHAQHDPASRYDRLAEAAKLWARIHYTHPWLAWKQIDFDQSFANAAPKLLTANSKEEYRAGVTEMLGALGDPATYVRDEGSVASPEQQLQTRQPDFRVTEDGILILDPGQTRSPEAFRALWPRVLAELQKPTARALVIDARQSSSFIQVWNGAMTVHSAPGLALVSRRWSGYPSPTTQFGYGGYSASINLDPGPAVAGSPKGTDKLLVVVAGAHTNLPGELVALQSAGKAAIVLEGPHRWDASVPQASVNLPFGLVAVIRTSELQHPDGTYGFAGNREVDSGGLEAALEIARSGKISPVARPPVPTPLPFRDKPYDDMTYPSEGYRLLAALRVWSVFQYFFPYKDLIGEDWNRVLPQALEQTLAATNALDYNLAIARLVARTNDTHCFVSSPALAAHWGTAPPPLIVRWIENRPVVTLRLSDATAAGIAVGDVVVAIDGHPVEERIEALKPLVAASTTQSKYARVMGLLLNGPNESKVTLTIEKAGGERKDVTVPRSNSYAAQLRYDREGPPFRKLNDQIGYVDLPRLDNDQVDAMFEAFKDTKAIIMDMRGYPRGTAWSIAPRLSSKPEPVNAQFRRNTLENGEPGTKYFEQRLPRSNGPTYQGRTVMLIDERAISQSEHSGLMYRTANGTQFIGTPTTGANGDVTYFFAPGGIRINFSGHDVRWPDGSQLQRIGLRPDIHVAPTIQGIREGRDEILQKAIEHLGK
jgi:C-terminal processing protease CtpA/Prc